MEINFDQTAGVIVKCDRTERTRYTPQYKHEVHAAFESSSLSAPVFGKQCVIKFPTLAGTDRGLKDRLTCGAVARASDAEQICLLAALLRHLAAFDATNSGSIRSAARHRSVVY